MTHKTPGRRAVMTALGIVQILAWGSSFYIPAVLAGPIVAETGWSLGWVVGGASVGLLTAGLIYAAIHLVVALPLQLYAMRGSTARAAADASGHPTGVAAAAIPREPLIFALLALVMTLAAGIGSIVVVHLMIFLQARGVEFASAVALGTLFGGPHRSARA